MAYRRTWDGGRALVRFGLASASVYVLGFSGPIFNSAGEFSLLTAGAMTVLAASATTLTADAFWLLGRVCHWRHVNEPRGHKGKARWVKSISELRKDLIPHGKWGLYWGTLKRGHDALFADTASNALCLGPSGSSKDTANLLVNVLSVRESKTILCLKGDTPIILADALRARGEIVYVINVGDVYADQIGPSAHINPLDSVADCFFHPGGIADVTSEIAELCQQLYPPPASEGENKNRFWDNGSVTLISFCILICVLVSGHKATLGDVLQMLNDRESLLQHALWVAGRLEQDSSEVAEFPLWESSWVRFQSKPDVEAFTEYLRALASGIADQFLAEDTRSVDSFLIGARDQLASFNITTRAHKIMQASTFRFAEQKEEGKTVTVFLVADSSRLESQKKALEIIQHHMLNAWKRHPNKHKSVYLFANEITNLKLAGLESLLTWGRAYSIKIILYLQSLAAFERVYGKHALDTMLSETEIKQILPGQREPDTIRLIVRMLGQQSYIGRSYQTDGDGPLSVKGSGMSEDAAPLMDEDQVRRCKKTILFIRQNRPALVYTPSIAAIAPWRSQQGISPFYGRPYRLPVELRLHFRGWSIRALWRFASHRIVGLLADRKAANDQ